MTSMVAGGLFNAIAFAGAGFLFSKLNKTGYEEEIKRHNLATEELSRAKEEWYEQEVELKNRIAKKRRELDDANADINSTNKALDNLAVILRRQVETLELERKDEPHLSAFYEPSDEMKEYEALTVGAMGLGGGYASYKAYRYFWK